MKTLPKNFRYFFLLAGIITLFSCTKTSTENKLLGTWKMMDVTDISDSSRVERWQFVSDGKLKIYVDANGVTDSLPKSVLHYTVQSYKKLTFVPSDSLPATDYCRDWEISKLNKDVMILTYESGGVLQKEFVKL